MGGVGVSKLTQFSTEDLTSFAALVKVANMKILILVLCGFGFLVENHCYVQRDDLNVDICERIPSRFELNLEDVMYCLRCNIVLEYRLKRIQTDKLETHTSCQ